MFRPFAQVLCGAPSYDGNNRTKLAEAARREQSKKLVAEAGSKLIKEDPVLSDWEQELKRLGF